MSNIVAKELTKSPFKNKDNFEKVYDKLEKIYADANKEDLSEREEELFDALDKLLQKEEDAMTLRIMGNILEESGCTFAFNFYHKSEELGYVLENNRFHIQLESNYKTDIFLNNEDYARVMEKMLSFVNENYKEDPYSEFSVNIFDGTNKIASLKIDESIYAEVVKEFADLEKYMEVSVTKGNESEFNLYVDFNKFKEIEAYVKSEESNMNLEAPDDTELYVYDLTVTNMKTLETALFTLLNEEMYNKVYEMAYEQVANETAVTENQTETPNDMEENNLRKVKITYADGTVVNTNMAAHLSDEEIMDYYKPGKMFNIGNTTDNMQAVAECEILENYTQVMPLAKNYEPKIFGEDEIEVPEFNERALRELIKRDYFLKYVQSQMDKADETEELNSIYKDYVKDNEQYLSKLKTFENYTNNEMASNTADFVYKDIINDLLSLFNVHDKDQAYYAIVEYLTKSFEKFQSEYAVLPAHLKTGIKSKFSALSEADIVSALSEANINFAGDTNENITNIATALDIDEELALVVLGFMTSVYNEFKLRRLTADDNYCYVICLAIIFKNF